MHPYDDEQFLHEHPDVREKVRGGGHDAYAAPPGAPPSHSRSHSQASVGGSSGSTKKKGFLGKLKDKAIGTKEEREAERIRSQQVRLTFSFLVRSVY